MPEELWRSAAELARKRGVYPVVRALGLNYYSLRKRVDAPSPPEPNGQPRFVDLGGLVAPGCVLELEAASGARMTVRIPRPESVDLRALAAELWGARP